MTGGAGHSDDRARRWRRAALVALLSLSLGACGGLNLFGKKGPPPQIFDLSPKSTFDKGLPNVTWQLVVQEPYASRVINNDQIAVRRGGFKFAYYKGVRWSDRSARMIQNRMVESFENSSKITAVGRQAIGLRSDYELLSELREFQAELPNGEEAPEVWVRISFKIVRHPSTQIIASKTFERRVKAKDGEITSVVTAFDDALGAVMKRAVQWTLVTAEEHYKPVEARKNFEDQ